MTNTLPVFLLENLVPHRDWGLVGEFGANGPKMVFEAKLGNPLPDLHKKPLILFRIPCKKDQTFLLKIQTLKGAAPYYRDLGQVDPKLFWA